MKTFNRSSLPDSIIYNGRIYLRNISLTASMLHNRIPLSIIEDTLKKEKRKGVLVKVLAGSLRGKTDLHRKPYEPTRWIYTTEPKTNVLFLVEVFPESILAVFPDSITAAGRVMCYSAIGQHSDTTIDYYKVLKRATPEQYASLENELKKNYNLNILK